MLNKIFSDSKQIREDFFLHQIFVGITIEIVFLFCYNKCEYASFRSKWGNIMKKELIIKKCLCFFAVATITAFTSISAFAIDYDGDGIDDEPAVTEYSEPQTEYVEPLTEFVPPQTEYVEPMTEYVEPQTEYVEPETEYAEPETEYVEPQTEYQYMPVETYPADENSSTAYQAPTLAKTVSTKSYSTNDTAGIVSWACVGAGAITLIFVLISTKISGRR